MSVVEHIGVGEMKHPRATDGTHIVRHDRPKHAVDVVSERPRIRRAGWRDTGARRVMLHPHVMAMLVGQSAVGKAAERCHLKCVVCKARSRISLHPAYAAVAAAIAGN